MNFFMFCNKLLLICCCSFHFSSCVGSHYIVKIYEFSNFRWSKAHCSSSRKLYWIYLSKDFAIVNYFVITWHHYRIMTMKCVVLQKFNISLFILSDCSCWFMKHMKPCNCISQSRAFRHMHLLSNGKMTDLHIIVIYKNQIRTYFCGNHWATNYSRYHMLKVMFWRLLWGNIL